LQDPQTHLYRKAMLVVKPEQVQQPDAPPRDAPRGDAATLGKPYKLYNVFFVFAESNPQNLYDREEEFVLIGSAQSFYEASVAKTIQGWVPKSRVEYWTTTEAVAWDVNSTLRSASPRRQVPGYIYKTREAAEQALQAAGPRTSSAVADPQKLAVGSWFPEPRDPQTGEGVPYEPHHSRFPLFDRLMPEGRNYLLEVGGIGGWGGMSSIEVDNLRQRLERIGQQLQQSELLFVIDSTGSMSQYRDALAKVADAICRATQDEMKQVKEEDRVAAPVYKLGVTFYSDLARPQDREPGQDEQTLLGDAVTAQELAQLHESGIDANRYGGDLAHYIRQYPQRDGHDYPEAVSWGLKRGIETAVFSPSARKLVVLVGDCGDAGQRPGFPKPPTAEELADLFCPPSKEGEDLDRAPIEFYALQVCDPNAAGANEEERGALNAFSVQMQKLCELINERSTKWIKRPIARYDVATNGAIARPLEIRLNELRARRAQVSADMEKARSGRWDLGPEMVAELKRRGIDPDLLPKETQLFQRGYVWHLAPDMKPKEAIPQVRIQYLLDGKTVLSLYTLLDSLGKVTPSGEEITLQRAFQEAVAAYARETFQAIDEKATVESYIKKATGLNTQTPILRQAMEAKLSPREFLEGLAMIEYRKRLLADILGKKQRRWREFKTSQAGFDNIPAWREIEGTEADFDRSFSLPGGEGRWYWIDQDEAP